MPSGLQGIDMSPEAQNAIITTLFELGYNRGDLAKAFDLTPSSIYQTHKRCVERKSFKRPLTEKQKEKLRNPPTSRKRERYLVWTSGPPPSFDKIRARLGVNT